MPKKQQQQSPAAGFGDDEMEQIKRFGQALGGGPTDFDEEVEKALDARARAREAGAAKMQAAATGGSTGLGPTEAEQALAKQQAASTGAGAAASAR
jgi:hypothetical protein